MSMFQLFFQTSFWHLKQMERIDFFFFLNTIYSFDIRHSICPFCKCKSFHFVFIYILNSVRTALSTLSATKLSEKYLLKFDITRVIQYQC